MKTRKIVSLLAVSTLVLALFAAMPALAATNYLTDSIGFEGTDYSSSSIFDGWTINSTASSSISGEVTNEKAYSGSNSLKLTILNGTSATQVAYTGGSTLTAGTEYTFTMMVLIPESIAAETGTGGVQARLNLVSNGSGGTTTSWLGGAAYHYTGDEWQEISGTFVAAADTNFAFRFRDGAVTNGVFYVDDIAVYSTAELEAEEKAEEEERAAKNFYYVSEYRKTLDDELYLDMEGTLSDSFTVSNASVNSEGSLVYQGSASAGLTITDAGEGYMQSKIKPAFQQNVEYEASVWAYIPAEKTVSQVRMFMDLGSGNTATADGASARYVQRKVQISSAEKGRWFRIAVVFTPAQAVTPSSIRLMATGSANDALLFDNFTIVQKQSQKAVLQLTKSVTLDGGGTLEADVTSPGAGVFTVKYDFHKASATNAGKVLIAGIYKDTGAGKQLVEVKMAAVSAEASSVSVAMNGIETPDESYSLKVMYWDSLEGMFGYRTAEFAF